MDNQSYQTQQAAYDQGLAVSDAPVIESASATTNIAANTSSNTPYIVFAVVALMICFVLTQAVGFIGTVFGETVGEFAERYGDEFSLEDFEEFQGQLGDDPVSPDFGDLLDGESNA